MKCARYLVAGLTGAFIGISATIGYMEYITRPTQGYQFDKNQDGINDSFRIRDRRGKITDIDLGPSDIMLNKVIKDILEKRSSDPNNVPPTKKPYKPSPRKRIFSRPKSAYALSKLESKGFSYESKR